MMSTGSTESPKQEAVEVLAGLPDSVSWEEIEYAIHVRRKIREGREAVRRGETVSSDEARKQLQEWLQ